MTLEEREKAIRMAIAWVPVAFVTDRGRGVFLKRKKKGEEAEQEYEIKVYGMGQRVVDYIGGVVASTPNAAIRVDTIGGVSNIEVFVPNVGDAVDLANQIAEEGGF